MKITDLNVLEVGTVFYECEYGMNMKMIVTTKPKFEDGKWFWKAKNSAGYEIDYLITEGYEHYGPSIYTEPAYVKS